jgi:hypothetical protein
MKFLQKFLKKKDLTKLEEAEKLGLITKEEMLRLKYERALEEYKKELLKGKKTVRKPRSTRARK